MQLQLALVLLGQHIDGDLREPGEPMVIGQ
jgi:hypothetical protein